MCNLYYYITLPKYVSGNLFNKISEMWDIDFCSPADFISYVWHLWCLNKTNFKHSMTFELFLLTEIHLLHEAPLSFKLVLQDKSKW